MPISFTCQTCGTAYRLPDTAVAGGTVRVRCARCRSIFTVAAPAGAPDGPPAAPPHSSAPTDRPPRGGFASRGWSWRTEEYPGAPAGTPAAAPGEPPELRAPDIADPAARPDPIALRAGRPAAAGATPAAGAASGSGAAPGAGADASGSGPRDPRARPGSAAATGPAFTGAPVLPGPAATSPPRPDVAAAPPGREPAYELGPLPDGEPVALGPELGEFDAARPGPGPAAARGADERPDRPRPLAADQPSPLAAGGRTGPGLWLPGRPGRSATVSEFRPFRRLPPPPAVSSRRAFLIGLGGVVGLAVAGRLSWGAWQQRNWLAFLSGDPFPVEVVRRRPLTGRAGPLYVVEGTVRNLTGSPKGYFEIRSRLLDRDGQPLAEKVAHAGTVLEDAELKALPRAELERRLGEARLGDGMANARVPPRGEIRFQVVFVPAPPSAKIARAEVELAGVKDVP